MNWIKTIWEDVTFWKSETQTTHNELESISDCDVIGYFGHSFLWLVVLVFLLFFLLWRFDARSQNGKRRFLDLINNHIAWVSIATWIFGFLTYCVGTWVPDDPSFLSVIPMAMIHATGMFIMESDISAIHPAQHNSALFMFCFNISHFMAMFCSMAFIFYHFGFLLTRNLAVKWHNNKWAGSKDKNLYIFWGTNKNALLLAQKIYEKKNSDDTIVFVRTYEDEESQSKEMGFRRIFDLIKMRDKELEKLRDINGYVLNSFQRLSKITLSSEKQTEDILGSMLKLSTLVTMIRNATGTVNFIMLGDDSESNIRATVNLIKDNSIQDKDVHIYCHARKSNKNRYVEYYRLYNPEVKNQVKVHLVDSAYLSILDLKSHVEYHPISMLTPTEKATVEEDFNALIIGFGETGEEAFRYLYEFSSFVKSDGTRTGFNCSVIDKNIETLKGEFLEKCPGLKDRVGIKWEQAEVGTTCFWKVVTEALKIANCVVLTLNDDEMQSNLMAQIFRKLCFLRTNQELSKVKIFVRIYDEVNSAGIYELAQLIRRTNQDDESLQSGLNGPEIVPFGLPKDIYTPEIILDEKVLKEAKEYNYNYQIVLAEIEDITKKDADRIWKDCFENMSNILDTIRKRNERKKIKGSKLDSTNRMLVAQDIIRQIEENISNSKHQQTKLALAKNILNVSLQRRPTTIQYSDATEAEKEVLINLARCEHERWIASHLLKGYVYGPEKDHRLNTHPDIVSWDKLDEYTQSYDCSVVDTTIRNNR